MHGKRPEHPAVFAARMQHHKDQKKTEKNEGSKATDKDAAQDSRETAKRKASFQRKAADHAKSEQAKPARGVLTHLLPDQ